MIGRGAALLGGVGLGVVSGIPAVVLHQKWVWLLLGLVAAGAAMRALGPGAARVGFALGWAVVVLRGALTTPAGDYLIPADAPGWSLLVASLVLLLAAMATLPARPGTSRGPRAQPVAT